MGVDVKWTSLLTIKPKLHAVWVVGEDGGWYTLAQQTLRNIPKISWVLLIYFVVHALVRSRDILAFKTHSAWGGPLSRVAPNPISLVLLPPFSTIIRLQLSDIKTTARESWCWC